MDQENFQHQDYAVFLDYIRLAKLKWEGEVNVLQAD
jgi:hypothetical protein